jgi:hypothetical protein
MQRSAPATNRDADQYADRVDRIIRELEQVQFLHFVCFISKEMAECMNWRRLW